MFCSNCGNKLDDSHKFCPQCGSVVGTPQQQVQQAPQQMPPQAPQMPPQAPKGNGSQTAAIVAMFVAIVIVLGVCAWLLVKNFGGSAPQLSQEQQTEQTGPVEYSTVRPQLLDFSQEAPAEEVTPVVEDYRVSAGLSNVINADQFYLSDQQKQLLQDNLFYVTDNYDSEFFELYEYNRYAWVPNYVTVDSMMHTYHLYFSLLLNRTEKNYLSDKLLTLSDSALRESMALYDELRGTEWEEAARKNVIFFGVAAALQDPAVRLPDYAAQEAEQCIRDIEAAAGISPLQLTESLLDYSQFKPRGYYEGDEVLERYFRAMMWYGQINFTQEKEVLNRCALLMTLAMEPALDVWEEIYTITTCFAGASDDLGYYEYAPAIREAYGTMPEAADLEGNNKAFRTFLSLIDEMDPPAINSIPVWQYEEGDLGEMTKGFRFMGQRFSVDAAVMQQLIYRQVTENSRGEQRLLPDALDVTAAMGSDMAMQLLEQQGATEFEGYSENMQALRETLAAAPESSWTTSLYSAWLYTLDPLLDVKGEGYPAYMRTEQWQKRALECFLGSYTELKHDTVLYSKQVMAEMGGGPPEERDDRGYVEPEAEVYRRFMLLAQQTAEGLDRYGVISAADRDNLSRLEELARQLMVISQKELRNETLTDEEYELIKCYGGTLEHFWEEAVRDKAQTEYLDSGEFPASLVTDIATDPNGSVLQVATGKPAEIVVVVPVDGTLRLASGVVYNFYQFEQPIDQRLTDKDWHQMTGEWYEMDGSNTYTREDLPEKPAWTQSYWATR